MRDQQLTLSDALVHSYAVPKASLRMLERLRSLGPRTPPSLRVAGLFAGIGGLEQGLHQAGHSAVLLCDNDEAAQGVLKRHFPGVPIVGDISQLRVLPSVDLLAAGFPCQDLSQAGRTAGIGGRNSGLVEHIFRLLEDTPGPKWVLVENVPFMLQLDRGQAMRHLTSRLCELGFAWAYRVVDTRAFGIPQRRKRVLLLASRTEDPRKILFHGDEAEPSWPDSSEVACGFYWTEGTKGLGWAVDAVPTLKAGSTIGIPSPPAIRFPDGFIGTPDVRDAERLQGFDTGWTAVAGAEGGGKKGVRWRLIGNAVSVPVARWVGERLQDPQPYRGDYDAPLSELRPWPKAAWGEGGKAWQAEISEWPLAAHYTHLADFLENDVAPLSLRAAEGFLGRARDSSLRFVPGFLDDVSAHVNAMRQDAAAA